MLNLPKGSIAVVIVFTFSNIYLMYAFPPFALKQKVEPKVQGKPEPLRASCRPRTTTVIPVYIIPLLHSMQLIELLLTTFSKPHALLSGVTNDRRCPAFLFLKYSSSPNTCGIRRCTSLVFLILFSTPQHSTSQLSLLL
jgi:hypothetical protein